MTLLPRIHMSKVLVVGARSFIGQHLIRKLKDNGDHVTGLVRNMPDKPEKWMNDVHIISGDITEKSSLAGLFKDKEIVYHLAAKVHDFSNKGNNADEHFTVNVSGTKNILDECIHSGIRHFVNFSSIKAMAGERGNNLDETISLSPETPYGKSKLEAEKIVEDYGKKYKFRTTSLRLPLVYGPGNKGNIYKMIEAVDSGRFVMIGRGTNRRSMVYVQNVVDAALSVVSNSMADSRVYIITDGIDYSMKELYDTICKGLGKRPRSFFIPMSLAWGIAVMGSIAGSIIGKRVPFNLNILEKLTGTYTFSSLKIQREIGFKPRYNLYNTISDTINWYKTVRHV